MMKFLISVFAALFVAVRNFLFLGVAIGFGMLIARFFCDINAGECYSWISGIWHGGFFIPNYARSILNSDVLYKATNCTTMYSVYWWIVVILQIPTMLAILFKIVIEPIFAAFATAGDR